MTGERAAANVVGTAFLQRHELTDDLLDAGGIHDALYGLFVNHILATTFTFEIAKIQKDFQIITFNFQLLISKWWCFAG